MSSPVRSRGEFASTDPYFTFGYSQHLDAFEELLGHGWRLEPGEPTAKVANAGGADASHTRRSALLGHVQHGDTPATSQNRLDRYTFEVSVAPERYHVQIQAGHSQAATAQRKFAEGPPAGDWDLEAGEWPSTETREVYVEDALLTILATLASLDTGSARQSNRAATAPPDSTLSA